MHTVTRADTETLKDLYSRTGPFASVYFDVRATGREEALPRWRALADDLAAQGADAVTLEAVEDAVMRAVPGPGAVAVFVAGGQVVQTVDLPGWDQTDAGAYGELPHVLPLLRWLQGRPAFVTAVVDRTGADVTVHPGGTADTVKGAVTGTDDEIERNAPGGWSQGRYQHRAEDSWEHNSAQVADVLARTLDRYDARILLLAGDVRALQYLEKHLPARVKQAVTVRRVSGSRSPDGSSERRAQQIDEGVRLAVADQTSSLLAKLDEGRHPGGRAVEGIRATLRALARGQVHTLLVCEDAGTPRTVWYVPGTSHLADHPAPLEKAGERPRSARLVDATVRAAVLGGADVRVLPADVPGGPRQGIGVISRLPRQAQGTGR